MKTLYYEFADGYRCYYIGKPDKNTIKWEEVKHGKVIVVKVVGTE